MRREIPRDNLLLVLPVLILSIGLFFIYSASWRDGSPLDQRLVMRQMMWMAVALILTVASFRVHYRRLLDVAWPLYWISIFLLVVVLFMPARLGARRWMDLGLLSFQPSEIAKLAVILVLAAYFKENKFEGHRSRLWIPIGLVALPFALILKEPDLGTGLLLIPVLAAMLYIWGFRFRWMLGLLGVFAVISPFLYTHLHDYQKARIAIFLNPGIDPYGAGYTITQSKIAIGSGGLVGKGFLSGTQTQLQFLPEKHTDFIFAVIGEEGGFVAAAAVLIFYWVIVYKGFHIANKCHNRFGQFVAVGITTLFAFQAIINMAMTSGLMPVVGVPLLLVSYGGSSLLVTMFLIGLLINIGMRRDPFL